MNRIAYTLPLLLLVTPVACSVLQERKELLARIPDFDPGRIIENHEWGNEEPVTILGFTQDIMKIAISPDDKYLLFSDRVKPNKDMHWAIRVNTNTYMYQGRVENTVTDKVDGTPSFDAAGQRLSSFPCSW